MLSELGLMMSVTLVGALVVVVGVERTGTAGDNSEVKVLALTDDEGDAAMLPMLWRGSYLICVLCRVSY